MPTTVISPDISDRSHERYNATATCRRQIHDELLILRVRPDGGVPTYEAGQYTTLGLGYWEPRASDCDQEHLAKALETRLVQRAYSISSPILDEHDRPVRVNEYGELEFYVVLIRHGETRTPALTPRLFALDVGSRLFVGPHPKGHYTLGPVRPDDHVIFLATGTGEAPHNAMLGELLARGHCGRILNVVSVRNERDLGYLPTHRRVESQWSNYRYVTLTTREPRNVDPTHPEFVGKIRLQDFITSNRVAESLGQPFDPSNCHVFLCGNPAMVGIPKDEHGRRIYPQPIGMIELLERIGFQADRSGQPGNIHFEKYW
ncbi:MAG TPA: ferredoxin--NADP reductase [Planctomycetaceae bacterium]|nr:ferredoxin--NADP reductase [Planctomycetaceae bacterium]